MVVFLIIVGVVLVFALMVAVRTIKIIPQARAGVVERLGRYHRTLAPGLAVVSPFWIVSDRWLTFASRWSTSGRNR